MFRKNFNCFNPNEKNYMKRVIMFLDYRRTIYLKGLMKKYDRESFENEKSKKLVKYVLSKKIKSDTKFDIRSIEKYIPEKFVKIKQIPS